AGDPAMVSSGAGDPGGVSYGSYQLKSKDGDLAGFLANEGNRWASRFAGLKPGAEAYGAAWRQAAAEDPDEFGRAQSAYADRVYYRPQVERIQGETGLDVTTRSRALQNAVYSTSVQHGSGTGVIVRAVNQVKADPSDPAYDADLINAIYAERGRTKPDG